MDNNSPKINPTFRQALAGKWQIPLFVLSLASFVCVLLMLRPEGPPIQTFDEKYQALRQMALAGEYESFYRQAELLRQEAQTGVQVGRLHGLAAETRMRELTRRHEIGLDSDSGKSTPGNYQMIVDGYGEAFKQGVLDPNSDAAARAFHDVGLAFWGLDEPDRAIRSLRLAIEARSEFDLDLHKKLVQMYLTAQPENYLDAGLELLEAMLVSPDSAVEDRAWAFVRKAQVLIVKGEEARALTLLESADPAYNQTASGEEIELMRGRALRQAGRADEADKLLRDLLGRMQDRGDTYAQVALELGKINYEQFRDFDAYEFYRQVLQTQAGKDWYVAGALGAGECLALQKRYGESLGYYRRAVDLIKQKPRNLAVTREAIQGSLAEQARVLGLLRDYGQAIDYLDMEMELAGPDDIISAYRYARMHARQAEQLSEQLAGAQNGDAAQAPSATDEAWRQQRQALIARHYGIAADYYLQVSAKVANDKQLFSDSLWYAATCYDSAGNTAQAIETWKKYVNQHEGEPQWPQALKNLAQAYQSQGAFDAAIHYYQLLHSRHPNAPAAFDSAIPMARCYMLLETPGLEQAEALLLGLLSNPALTPDAVYFRQALFELGELYYKQGDYKKAIGHLTEAIDRYPGDPIVGKCMFLVGDSYRKNGLALDESIRKLTEGGGDPISRENLAALRADLLTRAEQYFRQAVNFYEAVAPANYSELDELYLRHGCMYRADCLFELGQYSQAVLLYEDVAMRYQLSPTALMAFMQVMNCHFKLNQPEEARSANRRALWQLSKMPEEALASNAMSMSRQQWQEWFGWTDRSGLW